MLETLCPNWRSNVAKNRDFPEHPIAGWEDVPVDEESLDDDEGAFLSPADVQDLLESLEDNDRRLLGIAETGIEGTSASVHSASQSIQLHGADSVRGPKAQTGQNAANRPLRDQSRMDAIQSDMLARIANEVRSIKMELAGIKRQYEEDRSARVDSNLELAQSEQPDSAICATPTISKEAMREEVESQHEQALHVEPRESQVIASEKRRYLPEDTFEDLKRLLNYLDSLLEALPEEKIDEFARSEYFELYRRVFEFFGLV